MKCTATTKAGKPCRANAIGDTGLCAGHAGVIGGPTPGAGRPRKLTPTEVLREKIEADIEKWLAPFEEALEAVLVVTYQGTATVTQIADLEARQQAAMRVLDRVYGRPRQMTELTGAGGGPITITDLARLAAEEPADEDAPTDP